MLYNTVVFSSVGGSNAIDAMGKVKVKVKALSRV